MPTETTFADAIYHSLNEHAINDSIDFRRNVHDWINACLYAGGTPMFKTRYAGKRFTDAMGHPIVLGISYGGRDIVKHRWFNNVPLDIVNRMEAGTGDWKWLKESYPFESEIRQKSISRWEEQMEKLGLVLR